MTKPPFHFLLWKDAPSVQPFQAEERGKHDELQGPEFQACEQTTLAQSTCPGKESGVYDTYVSTCVHVVCVHVVSAVWYVRVLCVWCVEVGTCMVCACMFAGAGRVRD